MEVLAEHKVDAARLYLRSGGCRWLRGAKETGKQAEVGPGLRTVLEGPEERDDALPQVRRIADQSEALGVVVLHNQASEHAHARPAGRSRAGPTLGGVDRHGVQEALRDRLPDALLEEGGAHAPPTIRSGALSLGVGQGTQAPATLELRGRAPRGRLHGLQQAPNLPCTWHRELLRGKGGALEGDAASRHRKTCKRPEHHPFLGQH
mmetsp:Transcript_126469/g.352392  ORF Transcript_126469/g.352392 Transcript_126469/m.352392 type:complete len:206 (-) Transcript_126469:62-679(-)